MLAPCRRSQPFKSTPYSIKHLILKPPPLSSVQVLVILCMCLYTLHNSKTPARLKFWWINCIVGAQSLHTSAKRILASFVVGVRASAPCALWLPTLIAKRHSIGKIWLHSADRWSGLWCNHLMKTSNSRWPDSYLSSQYKVGSFHD